MRPCPICDFFSKSILVNKFAVPSDWILPERYYTCECINCGMVYADTPLSQAGYDEYYRTLYHTHNGSVADGRHDKVRMSLAAEWLIHHPLPKQMTILDVGSGSGYLANILRDCGYTVDTLDPYAEADYKGTIADIPSIMAHDVIILSHVLEHVVDLRQAMLQINGRCKYVYCEVPDLTLQSHAWTLPYFEISLHHINHFTPSTLIKLFTDFDYFPVAMRREILQPTPVVGVLFEKNDGQTDEYFDLQLSNFEKILQTIQALNEPVILYGYGECAMRLVAAGIQIAGIMDDNPVLIGKAVQGIMIKQTPENGTSPIVIVSTNYAKDMAEKCAGYANKVVKL
jgi:hypothetical protein